LSGPGPEEQKKNPVLSGCVLFSGKIFVNKKNSGKISTNARHLNPEQVPESHPMQSFFPQAGILVDRPGDLPFNRGC